MKNEGIFVIFGITGDLAKRKLMPALYHLVNTGQLTDSFRIIGTTRRNTKTRTVIEELAHTLESSEILPDEATLEKLESMITMVNMEIDSQDDYHVLADVIDQIESEYSKPAHRLFYLAVPPEMFTTIVYGLNHCDLHRSDRAESRLLLEKPFGYDTETALELINKLEKVFAEKQIYRVDHYLAKETAQNIMTFRFNNPLFQAVWDNSTVDQILITASEKISIEGRSNFYEKTGALRDLIQSHLIQLLALVTMEEPKDRSSQAIHASKQALLDSIKAIPANKVSDYAARGQYKNYREEVGNPDSITETFAALRVEIDNDRWRDVPVLIRTGKAMAVKVTEITLIFKSKDKESDDKNALTLRIQPDEGIVLSLLAKKPSLSDEKEVVQMEFCYNQSFPNKQPDAYEKVLIDAIRGDKTLFTTDKEALSSWRIIDNVLKAWSNDGKNLEIYENGSWGPESADKLAERANARWMTKRLHIPSINPVRKP